MKKQFLSILIVTVLLASTALSACSETQKPSGSTAGSTVNGTADGLLSWQKDTSPVTFTCFIDYDWYGVDTFGEDEISQEIQARTGVFLEVTKSSDPNQLGVMLASGDVADITFMDTNVQRLEDPRISAPWDELIPQYCPEFMDTIDPIEIINNTRDDGHFYTLRTHYANEAAWNDPRYIPSPGTAGLFFRGDILEAIGNPEIKSMDDLKSVFATVKDRGAELGIDVVYNPHPNWTNPLEGYFGINRTHYLEGDRVRYWRANPLWKEYLLFMNELFREGYIYKDYLAVRLEDFAQLNGSGKSFAASFNAGVATDTNKIFDDAGMNDKYFVANMEALTVNGENRYHPIYAAIGWSSCFLSAKSDKLERMIRYMQFLKSEEGDRLTQWGIEDKHYTLNDEGYLVRTEYYNEQVAQDITTGIGPWYFQASGLTEGIVISSEAFNPDPVTAGYHKHRVDYLQWCKQFYTRDPAFAFAIPNAESDEYMIDVKLADEWNKRTAEIIMAASSEQAAALYDDMAAYMVSTGVEKLEDVLTTKYFEAKKRYE